MAERKKILCEQKDCKLNEEASGEYTAKKMMIFENGKKQVAEIRTVGAWVIGANGRIDLIGDFDQQILVYLKKNPKIKAGITAADTEEYEVSKNGSFFIKDLSRMAGTG